METPYARITEIKETATSTEANECIGNGFVLIKAVEKRDIDALGRQVSSIVYILGRLKGNGNGHAASAPHTTGEPANIMDSATDFEPAVLEKRPWKPYAGGEGEWTFVVNKDGSPVAGLEPAKEFLERLQGGEDLVVGAYRYRLRGKFLKRYAVNGQSA